VEQTSLFTLIVLYDTLLLLLLPFQLVVSMMVSLE